MIIFYIILFLIAGYCVFQMCRWDIRTRLIPDVYLFPFLLIGFVVSPILPWISGGPAESAIIALTSYGLALGISSVFEILKRHQKKNDTGEAIGLGDIKLIAAGSVWLGATGLCITIIISALVASVWCWRTGNKFVPYAPFFVVGAICALITLLFLI